MKYIQRYTHKLQKSQDIQNDIINDCKVQFKYDDNNIKMAQIIGLKWDMGEDTMIDLIIEAHNKKYQNLLIEEIHIYINDLLYYRHKENL